MRAWAEVNFVLPASKTTDDAVGAATCVVSEMLGWAEGSAAVPQALSNIPVKLTKPNARFGAVKRRFRRTKLRDIAAGAAAGEAGAAAVADGSAVDTEDGRVSSEQGKNLGDHEGNVGGLIVI